jgi:hypothetical protein
VTIREVFPWILSNYESETLDLNDPKNFRDLSKPIGALNPERLAKFQRRFENFDDESIPPFHYGTYVCVCLFVNTLTLMTRTKQFNRIFSILRITLLNCRNSITLHDPSGALH